VELTVSGMMAAIFPLPAFSRPFSVDITEKLLVNAVIGRLVGPGVLALGDVDDLGLEVVVDELHAANVTAKAKPRATPPMLLRLLVCIAVLLLLVFSGGCRRDPPRGRSRVGSRSPRG